MPEGGEDVQIYLASQREKKWLLDNIVSREAKTPYVLRVGRNPASLRSYPSVKRE